MSSANKSFELAGVSCSTHGIEDFLGEIAQLLRDESLTPRTLLCVNAHIHNLASRNERLRKILKQARVVTADGMAVVWAARLAGHRIPARCNMTEAYHAFLRSKGLPPSRAILIGCSEEEAAKATHRANNTSSHCKIVNSLSGYLNAEDYIDAVRKADSPNLVLLGMGTPKTEEIANELSLEFPRLIVWGIGGGTIRIEAGTMQEAPSWWRRCGLQWLHRLLSEPRKLWGRYLLGNPLFAARVLASRFINRVPPQSPTDE